MIASWMAYVLLVSVLFAGAAHVLELAMRSLGRSARWTWTGALVASALVAFLALLPDGAPASESTIAGGGSPFDGVVTIIDPVSRMVTVPDLPPSLDPWLLLAWGVLSLGLILVILRATAALASARRGWKAETVNGRQVLVSDDYGPAVVGIANPAIVLPRWSLSGAQQDRELMIRHEEEHLAAGDAPLLLGALLLGALLPWNLPVWLMTRKLRLAVEIDCDRRVLEKTSSVRPYADLLVRVSQQMSQSGLRGLALARPAPFLERRVLAMTMASVRRPRLAVLFGALGGLLIVWACSLEAPISQPAPPETENSAPGEIVQTVPARTITLRSGSAAVLTRPDSITRASVGDHTIADFTVARSNQVVINGRTPGTTNLIVWSTAGPERMYRIDVVPQPASDMAKPTVEQDADPSTPGETLLTNPARTITVRPGSQALLTRPDTITRVSVGDATIADLSVNPPHQVVITGLTEGTTTLIIWGNASSERIYRIDVVTDGR